MKMLKNKRDVSLSTQKAAIYIRVSTEEQAKQGFSLSAQEDTLKNYATALGYEIYKIYRDEGKSAKDIQHRPALRQLLKDAEQKQFASIFVYKLDRFSRSLKDLILTIEKLKDWDVDFVSLQDKIETASASGKLMFHIISAFAEFERDIISERTRFGMAEKARGGGVVSKAPMGYKINNGLLEVDSEKNEAVKQIFSTFLNEHKSLNQIAKQYGLTTRGLIKVLSNRTYLGEIKFKEVFQGEHETLISKETFEQAQIKLNEVSFNRQFIKNYNLLDRILDQGDSRYYDPQSVKLISSLITQNAILLERRPIDGIKPPKEEDILEIEEPQKLAKYVGLTLLKKENLPDPKLFMETTFNGDKPDIAWLTNEKEIFVECFSCRINKVLSYLSQNKELWVLTKGAYPWDNSPLGKPMEWYVIQKGPKWESLYSQYNSHQIAKLKEIKNPLDNN